MIDSIKSKFLIKAIRYAIHYVEHGRHPFRSKQDVIDLETTIRNNTEFDYSPYNNIVELVSLHLQNNKDLAQFSAANLASSALKQCLKQSVVLKEGDLFSTLVKKTKWQAYQNSTYGGGYWKCRDDKGLYVNIGSSKLDRSSTEFFKVEGTIKYVFGENAGFFYKGGKSLKIEPVPADRLNKVSKIKYVFPEDIHIQAELINAIK